MKGHIEKEYSFTLDPQELTDFENFLRSLPSPVGLDAETKKVIKSKPFPQYLKHRFLGVISDLKAE